MHALLLTLALLLAADQPRVVVVCPREFAAAMQPWIRHRTDQGYQLSLVSSEGTPARIRDEIRQQAREGKLNAIVLVGDAEPNSEFDERLRARCTPVYQAPARVNVLWGSEPHIATDNWYADLDDDSLPDVPIGRLSVESTEQLSVVVEKIIAYEDAGPAGEWRRRVNFVAGVGGFGSLVDAVIESATKKFLTEGVPPAYETSMTYGSWKSPFCPDPRRFHHATLDRLNEGALFWVYIGHGQRRYLDQVRTPSGLHHIFDTDDIPKLRRTSGAPIAVFLACYAGAFDEARDCLGEELLRTPDGPVASLCGSRVTMPYAMAVLGNELLEEVFLRRRATLGEVVMHAKRRMADDLSEDEQSAKPKRHLLDAIAAAISPAPDLLREERLEHILMFNLLGDPLLRLRHPQEVTLTIADEVQAGQRLKVAGTMEHAGRCTLELVLRRDRTKTVLPPRERYVATDEALASYTEAYVRANDRVWARQEIDCQGGEFFTDIEVPDEAHGPCYVRAFVEREGSHALGAAKVFVRNASP